MTMNLLTTADIDFILLQLRLPGNNPLNAAGGTGTITDPTGIRDTQGVGNNVTNPFFGATDQLFPRLTTPSFKPAQGTFTFGQTGLSVTPVPTSYAVRDVNLIDSSPRTISNLVSSQSPESLAAIGYITPEQQRLAVLDEPTSTPGGRLSPVTGAANPLVYSGYMTLFGQFFDHGLDFVKKGADGMIMVPLLPGDPLYNHPDNAIYAGNTVVGYNNFILASRTNSVHVDIARSSTDALVAAIGLSEDRYTAGDPGFVVGRVTANTPISPDIAEGGVLILNTVAINIARGATTADLLAAINANTHSTGVSASVDGSNRLVLDYAANQSRNTVSPFIDLSQSYGSAPSHTAFVREYGVDNLANILTTGRLVSGIDTNLDGLGDGMATWADVKANALRAGVILHDKDVLDIPEVRLNADNSPFIGTTPETAGMWLVSRNEITGQVFYVHDSLISANTTALQLNADGSTTLINGAALDELKPHLILQGIGHAFLDDMAHGVLGSLNPATGDLTKADAIALLNAHFISGDGRTNENIGLTAIHDVFHSEHNRVLADVKVMVYGGTDSNGTVFAPRADAATWTGEMLFQAAKFVTEMEYQHLVFGEFTRKLSPNINVFATYDITIDPAITAEFAHAVYRFGHSMLTETVDMTGYNPITGLSTGENKDMGLIEAFLNPAAYTSKTAGEIALGMSGQVGNAIDEWVTDALRNNLVGLPLDLATLNIVRGRDTGMPSLNEVRAQLYAQTGMASLKPYANWDEFGAHLLHPESLENFIMAYARDAVLSQFGDANAVVPGTQYLSLTEWTTLQNSASESDRTLYSTALRAAAQDAINDIGFMSAAIGLNNIDLWLGGLAEVKVDGGMLGSTFDFVFATQIIQLQNADRFYYLSRLAGTELLGAIEAQLFSDIVMRNTGVSHLYSDIFSVADSSVEIGTPGTATQTWGTLNALTRYTEQVVDAEGVTRKVGVAGWVGDNNVGWTFYGNPGDYLDARGVFSPNNTNAIKGNASETIGGTDAADRINALGGNDTVWGDGGNDTINGGEGNDFLHGGLGNDTITDTGGDDLIWGNEGSDFVNAGMGIDQVFGGLGDDILYGGNNADVVDGNGGNDIVFGDAGSVTEQLVNGVVVQVLDKTGDADVITGGDGNDILFGGGGNDVIAGGIGNDAIYGGLGDDGLNGDFGDDMFYMDTSDIGFGTIINGGMDYDVVDYSASMGNGIGTGADRQGVKVDLNPIVPLVVPVPGPPIADLFLDIEAVVGSNFNDSIRGGANLALNLGLITDEFGNPVNFGPNPAFPVFRTATVNIDGGDGNDLIEGGDGSGLWVLQPNGTYAFDGTYDPAIGGPGADVLNGGLGNDTVSYASADSTSVLNGARPKRDGVTVDLSNVNVQNTVNAGLDLLVSIENVIGSDFNDTITGDANANVLDGGLTDDIITGGAGNDTLIGGDGDDVLTGGLDIDTVSFLSTNSTAAIAGVATPNLTGVTVDLSDVATQDTVNAGLDTLAEIENVIGSIFNDTATGGTDAVVVDNMLDGQAGDDTLSGGGGNDTLIGGLGNDVLDGGIGTDTVSYAGAATAVNANLAITTAQNTGGGGTDTLANFENLIGGNAGDTLTGDAAANLIDAGLGNDTINGAGGNDTLLGGLGDDNIDGGAGNDSLSGGAGNDTLRDGVGTNTLSGGTGNDSYIVGTGDTVSEALNEGADSVQTLLTSYTLTANVENLSYTGTTAFTGTGNTLDNLIRGAIGNDTLSGSDGNDTLIGSTGNDRLDGGTGIDTVSYALAATAVSVDLNAGTATGGDGTDALIAVENVIGSAGNDTLTGNAFANVLDGGAGNDSMAGGNSDDVYIVDSVNDTVTELAGVNTGTDTVRTSLAQYTLGSNLENLAYTGATAFRGTGNELDNRITGSALNDTLIGAAGNDTLEGGQGNDSMEGGAGNDTYLVDSVNDIVKETLVGGADAGGVDTVQTTLTSYTLGTNVENLTYTGSIGFYGTGNSLNNTVTGAAGDDTLVGGLGDDILSGGAGSDTASYASATGAVSVNLLTGVVSGQQGNDTVVSIENVIGSASGDTLIGNDSANRLDGGAGNDVLDGGKGNDTYVVDSVDDFVVELPGGGTDTVETNLLRYSLGDSLENLSFTGTSVFFGTGNELNNTLSGGISNDTLYGEGGNDTLNGGQGNDTLFGGAGNDTLQDGVGFNVLAGGEGNDTYIVADSASDRISEAVGEGTDTIQTSVLRYTLAEGNNIENLSFVGTTALLGVVGTGNEIDNTLYGSAAGDTLDGRAGNDTLVGGLGNDSLVGGLGGDTASYAADGSAITVTLRNGLGTSAWRGTVNAAVRGTTNSDSLVSIENVIGTAFNDSITGDDGDNIIEGGAGTDTLIGGLGNDTVSYAGASAAVTVNLTKQTTSLLGLLDPPAKGGADSDLMTGFENVLGSAYNDSLTGDGNANSLDGGFGNDTLSGGDGNDTLRGGAGNDSLIGGAGDDRLEGGAGIDSVSFAGDASAASVNLLTGASSGASGNDTLVSIENVTGTSFNDSFVSGAESNRLDGGAGIDTVSFAGASAGVTANLNTGAVTGGSGSDTLIGIENLVGSSFDDALTGDGNANLIEGAAGNDTLRGGSGTDTATYANATAAVTVSLATTLAQNTIGAGTDQLSEFENLTGSAFNDTLTGDGNANVLDGAAGNDSLSGGAGNDTLLGGAGDDTLTGGDGVDTVSFAAVTGAVTANLGTGLATGDGNDSLSQVENLIGSGSADTFTGDAAANVLDGAGGNDTLDGADGNDTLIGGTGADSIIGGAGSDTVSYASAAAAVNINLSTGVATEGAVSDALSGIENIIGSAFNDTLTGAAGANAMAGGAGDDTYVLDGADDSVTENAGEGTDLVQTTATSHILTTNVENLSFTGSGNFTGTGNTLNNLITGGSGNDTLGGDAGDDTLIGGNGNDALNGGAGTDTASYASATTAVTVSLALTTAQVTVGAGTDTLTAIENVTGGSANDTLTGSAGDNVIDGGTGADSMTGGAGNDTYVVDNAGDVVVESAAGGTDTVRTSLTSFSSTQWGTELENLVVTGSANFTTTGNAQNNVITGGAGNDTLDGGTGNDTLIGGGTTGALGVDVLTGGAGTDTASFLLAKSGVTVTLANQGTSALLNTQISGDGLVRLNQMENLIGSAFADTLTGDGNANVLSGGAGNDTLQGGTGNDTLTGGDGSDTASYAAASGAVTVNLGTGTASGAAGTDTLSQIENVLGGNSADTLTGDSNANLLQGGSGNDTLNGSLGNDTLDGGAGTDLAVFSGASSAYTFVQDGSGNYVIRGAGGNTTLIGVENIQFGSAAAQAVNSLVLTDIVPATVTAFNATTSDGVYRQGATVNLVATLSETVKAGSSLTVTLDTGATAVLSTATDGTTLTGTYTVRAGDNSADLNIASYALTSGVRDLVNNASTSTTLPVSNLADNRAIEIDTTAPVVTGFGATAANGAYRVGSRIGITASMSEVVQAGSSLTVTLDTGARVTLSSSVDSTSLRGVYTVGAGESSSDLRVVSYVLTQAPKDAVGNVMAAAVMPDTNIADVKAISIDTITPDAPQIVQVFDNVPAMTGSLASGDFTNDQTPTLTVHAESGAAVTILNGTTVLGTAVENGTSGDYVFTPVSSLREGAYAFNATVTDAAGNTSGASTQFDLTIDPTKPRAPTVNRITTSDSTPILSGNAQLFANESLTVTVGGVTYNQTTGVQVDTGRNTWSLELPTPLDAGTFTVVATITDAAHNASSDTTVNELVVNIGSPIVAAFETTTTDGAYRAGQQINITAQMSEVVIGGSSLAVTLNSGAVVVLNTAFDSDRLVGTYAVKAGENAAELNVTSFIGSVGPTNLAGSSMVITSLPTGANLADTSTLVIDTTAPATPQITTVQVGPTDALITGGVTNDTTPTVTINAEAGSTVRVYNGANLLGMATESATPGVFTYTPAAPLAGAAYALKATSSDQAGNTSSASSAYATFTIDATAPTTPTVLALRTNDLTPEISGTASIGTGETLTVTVNGVAYTTGAGLVITGSSWKVQLPELSTGVYEVEARVTDSASNSSVDITTTELVIETDPPVVESFTSNTPDGSYRVGASINITATTNEAVRAGSKLTVTLDTGDMVELTATQVGTTLTGTYVVGTGDNSNDLTVTGYTLTSGPTDVAGNVMTGVSMPIVTMNLAASSAIVVDTLAPNAPTIIGVYDDVVPVQDTVTNGFINDAQPSFSINAESGSVVRVYANASPTAIGTAVESETTPGLFAFTPDTPLADGAYDFVVKATDLAGNISGNSQTVTLTIDTRAPDAPTVNALLTSSLTPTLTGTAVVGAGETLEVTVGGQTFTALSGLVLTNTDWSLTLPKSLSLTDGAYQVIARVTDAASNVTVDSNSSELTIDTTAPVLTRFESTSPDGIYRVDDVVILTATVSETVQAGAAITVTLNTGKTVVLTAAEAGTTLSGDYTIASPDTSADLTVTGYSYITAPVDLVGNAMTSTTVPSGPYNLADSRAIVIDTTPRTAALASSTLSIAEGAAGALTTLSVDVNLSFAARAPIALAWHLESVGPTPAQASDFFNGEAGMSGVVNFAAGDLTQTLDIQIVGDNITEANEAFRIIFDSVVEGDLNIGAGLVADATILNDDGAVRQLSNNGNNVNITTASWVQGLGGNDAITTTATLTQSVVLDGGDGNDTLTGGAGADQLIGGLGLDSLNGGAGADWMTGGGDNDTYVVDDASDVVMELVGEGTDTVRTSLTLYTLGSHLENLVFTSTTVSTGFGNALNNVLTGTASGDALYGLAGNDTLDGGLGDDQLEGGLGDDVYVVAGADTLIESADAGIDTVQTSTLTAYTLGANFEHLTYTGAGAFNASGNELNNAITTGAGADALTGGAGDDTLNGGAGNDTLRGGIGNDTYVVDAGTDVITEGVGEGTDIVRTALASFSLAAVDNVEALSYSGTAAFTGTGNSLDNTIIGGAGNDSLNGGTGNDTLNGGAGNDTYVIDSATDVIVDTAGTDLIQTTLTTFSLAAQASIENLTFIGTGNFSGTGNSQANSLTGGGGNDTLDGSAGNDTMIGGAGDDTYIVDASTDVITETAGQGTDGVRTALASFSLAAIANVENLTYTGIAAFTGTGNTANNVIVGGAANDSLTGGTGSDSLTGGGGADTFVYSASGDSTTTLRDVITDFTRGTDRIDLSAIDANTGTNGNGAFAWRGTLGINGAGQIAITFDSVANQTIISGNTNNNNTTIELQIALSGNYTQGANLLTANDFIL